MHIVYISIFIGETTKAFSWSFLIRLVCESDMMGGAADWTRPCSAKVRAGWLAHCAVAPHLSALRFTQSSYPSYINDKYSTHFSTITGTVHISHTRVLSVPDRPTTSGGVGRQLQNHRRNRADRKRKFENSLGPASAIVKWQISQHERLKKELDKSQHLLNYNIVGFPIKINSIKDQLLSTW